MALQPPFLQELMDYPVITAGLVMGPRGVGTMGAMLLVGRLVGRVDTRILLGIGLAAHRLVVQSDDRLDAGRVAGDGSSSSASCKAPASALCSCR